MGMLLFCSQQGNENKPAQQHGAGRREKIVYVSWSAMTIFTTFFIFYEQNVWYFWMVDSYGIKEHK